MQQVPQRRDDAPAFGIDGLTIELSWRTESGSGRFNAWTGLETPALSLARELFELARLHASFESSHAWLHGIARHFHDTK